jgi:hypothetical protein
VDWARANGIDARSLNAWRVNLIREDPPAESRLIELVPTQPHIAASSCYRVRRGQLVVEVDDDFNEDVLYRLLGVVLSC